MTHALIQPALMLVMSAVVVGVLLIWVVPPVSALLHDLNEPLRSRRLIRTPAGRRAWDRVCLDERRLRFSSGVALFVVAGAITMIIVSVLVPLINLTSAL